MSESLDYQFFFKYFNNFKKFDAKAFDLALEHAYNYATDEGLSEEDLILISKVSFSQQLGVIRLRKLIRCLIPRRSVPDEVIEHVIDWFLANYNQNISPFAIKIVLQWFSGLIQYNIINPDKTIYYYYDLLWYVIRYKIVNVAACNLIYLLAKPEDVNRWYVKQLLKVHENFCQPKYTGALLLLFKSYRPDCVPENIPAYAVHKAFGALPTFITNHFGKAQELLESSNMITKNVDSIHWFCTDVRNIKRNAIKLIPNIIESEMSKLNGSKSLTSITNVKDLHKYLIQKNSPNSVMSLLNNIEGCFILMFGDQTLHERFSFQLYYTLYDAFFERNPYVSYEEKDKLLKQLCLLQNLLQQSIPVVSKFLAQFIMKWDGLEHEDHIYGLLHWINFRTFNELNECIFNFLYDLFISGTVQTKRKILIMLGHFSANIVKTYYCRHKNKIPCLFLNARVHWKFHEIIIKLYDFVTHLCKLGCYFENCHGLILNTVLDVNFLIMSAEVSCEVHIWKIPNFMSYSCLFTAHPSCFIRIFKLFNRFPSYVNIHIKKDYKNALWDKKAFVNINEPSVFDIFSDTQIQQLKGFSINIQDSLSVKYHLALMCFNYKLKDRSYKDIKEFEEFMKHATTFYPDIIEFLENTVQI